MPVRLALLAVPLLAACVGAPAPEATATVAPGPIASAERGCLDAVAAAAGAPASIVNSDFSEAGITFQIAAGAPGELWRCVGYSDGSASDVARMA